MLRILETWHSSRMLRKSQQLIVVIRIGMRPNRALCVASWGGGPALSMSGSPSMMSTIASIPMHAGMAEPKLFETSCFHSAAQKASLWGHRLDTPSLAIQEGWNDALLLQPLVLLHLSLQQPGKVFACFLGHQIHSITCVGWPWQYQDPWPQFDTAYGGQEFLLILFGNTFQFLKLADVVKKKPWSGDTCYLH